MQIVKAEPMRFVSTEFRNRFDCKRFIYVVLRCTYTWIGISGTRIGTTFRSNKSQAINSLLNLDRIDYIFADKFKVLTFCIRSAFRVKNSNSFRFIRGERILDSIHISG